ncbi:hypothetical protein B0J13DRAFT_131071 [Dactylonectria estremocensis]|uniref:Uncharacterized protein n=1 Tax=Dactylonectria estremocensis TaxID=1079267 RepID=A0A9P9E2R0_9HYPO|nr:hypothetical protein B0J13DRAFT_131071 [Dactylonectria estremocensis]
MAGGKNTRVTKRDRSNENFKKKWSTLKNNGLSIHQVYDAEVYVCIRRKGKKYEFKSTDKALPLSDEEKDESFPLPVLVTAADVARQRSSQDPAWKQGQRRETSQEGAAFIGNPPTEPEGGCAVEIE